jgi:hypothetical protein
MTDSIEFHINHQATHFRYMKIFKEKEQSLTKFSY